MNLSALKLGWSFISSGFDIKQMIRDRVKPKIDVYQDKILAAIQEMIDDPKSNIDEQAVKAIENLMDKERDDFWEKI